MNSTRVHQARVLNGQIFLIKLSMSVGHVGLKKKWYSSLPSLSTTKSGRSLYFSETVFLGKIFQELMVFGHFGPTTSYKIYNTIILLIHLL